MTHGGAKKNCASVNDEGSGVRKKKGVLPRLWSNQKKHTGGTNRVRGVQENMPGGDKEERPLQNPGKKSENGPQKEPRRCQPGNQFLQHEGKVGRSILSWGGFFWVCWISTETVGGVRVKIFTPEKIFETGSQGGWGALRNGANSGKNLRLGCRWGKVKVGTAIQVSTSLPGGNPWSTDPSTTGN